jgi:hypothetical protein
MSSSQVVTRRKYQNTFRAARGRTLKFLARISPETVFWVSCYDDHMSYFLRGPSQDSFPSGNYEIIRHRPQCPSSASDEVQVALTVIITWIFWDGMEDACT